EGVPFDTVVTSSNPALPPLSSTAAGGVQIANYEGVVVATSGLEGLSPAQWATLQTYEHQFSVRQVTAYVYPSQDYGLTTPAGGMPLASTTPLTLTSDGARTFPYLKAVSLDPVGTYGYEATRLPGANVDTLISGPNSSSMLGVYTAPDGRQIMYQTFDENQYMLQSELLRHGEMAWLARNTFFGTDRNYLETDIDDTFLADDSWSIGGTATTGAHSTDYNPADALREVPSDVSTAGQWSAAHGFRIDMLFNGGGSVQYAAGCTEAASGDNGTGPTTTGCSATAPGTDPLLAAFQAADPAIGRPYTGAFGWISHTWDHPNLDEGCATTNYIEAELNQNTSWGASPAAGGDPNAGGLGLAESMSPDAVLGTENPNVVITGEHSGLPNLVPGNPGQVDPPDFDEVTPSTTGGTLTAGSYEYAIADQFNTAAPGATPLAGSGESAASLSQTTVAGTTGSVALTWDAVCHAADYIIYRAPVTGTTVGAWSQIAVVPANTSTDFTNPTGNSTTTTAGGGPVVKSFTDTGAAGTPAPGGEPQTVGTAVESGYEQNPNLDAAFAATAAGGIKYFGSDASKPYPSPADAPFPTGGHSGTQTPAAGVFSDAGGTAIPRYPTNIYYNVSTNAEEVDEYQTLYDLPTCVPVSGVTTCSPTGTTFTIAQIIASVDQNMFQHMMGNDPRPHYFHQTNLMTSATSGVIGNGDGLYYETMDPLLVQYNQYFATNAPIVQPTIAQIAAVLAQQSAWAAGQGHVSGSITGNVVTVTNGTGAALYVPLSGTNVGSPYAGGQSGWTLAPAGASTYTALTAWPAPPTNKVVVLVPFGPKPTTGGRGAKAISYVTVQTKPKTVRIKRGAVTVTLSCRATRGRTARGHRCAGTLKLTLSRHRLSHRFSFKSGKLDRVTLKLSKAVKGAASVARRHRHRRLAGKLVITTRLTGKSKATRKGALTVLTASAGQLRRRARPARRDR
ncbi:MAG TPA: hypothetical protein VGG41_15200, partial [Solirubrobacteraceae bacterium]